MDITYQFRKQPSVVMTEMEETMVIEKYPSQTEKHGTMITEYSQHYNE